MSNLSSANSEMEKLSTSLAALGESIKTNIGDSISDLSEDFNTLSGYLDEISDQLSGINENLSGLGNTEGLTNLGDGLSTVLGMVASIFGIVFSFIEKGEIVAGIKAISVAFTGVGEAVTGLGSAMMGVFGLAAPEIALVAAAIAAIVGIVIVCWDEIKAIAEQIGTWINESFLTPLKETLGAAIEFVWEGHIKPFWERLKSFADSLRNAVMSIWDNFLGPIVHYITEIFFPPIVNAISFVGDVLATVVGFIMDLFNGVVEFLQGIVDFIAGVFSGDMDTAIKGILEMLGGIAEVCGGVIVGFINLIIDAINFVFNAIVGFINKIGKSVEFVGNIFGQDWGWEIDTRSPLKKLDAPKFAEGGIPDYGQLFIAREAGPEFVGSFGSRNVVMNNDQIVTAVSGGVYNAVRRANAEQTQQPIYLNVEAKVRENVLFDVMETVKAERGVRLSKGGSWYIIFYPERIVPYRYRGAQGRGSTRSDCCLGHLWPENLIFSKKIQL